MHDTLRSLAADSSPDAIPAPRGRLLAKVVFPLAVVLGAFAVLGFANRDRFVPRMPVSVARVAVAEVSSEDASDGSVSSVASMPSAATVTVQAPGWVEPDPHPIFVSALADGIVEELLVLEGDHVEPGQVVARLIGDDAELEVARAEAALARYQALFAEAETDWQEPVELERDLAVAAAALAEARAEQAALKADVSEKSALLGEAEAVLESLRPLARDVVPEVEFQTARLKRDARRAAKEAAESRLLAVAAQIARFEADVTAARRHLDLRANLKRRLAESRAAVAEAEAHLDAARLRLERMAVVAPVGGTVMDRLVAPGAKVMQRMDGATSAHIVHLYDPERLQVRVDVPLGDAAKIRRGQPASIVVDVLPDREFTGHVTRFVHQADISKNTVQVKVLVDNPSTHVKPDMLARVKFLGQARTTDGESDAVAVGAMRVYVPPEALAGENATAWVVDASSQRAYRRDIVVGTGRRMGWVEVLKGIHPGDVVVTEPPDGLTDGRRIRIRGEEDRT